MRRRFVKRHLFLGDPVRQCTVLDGVFFWFHLGTIHTKVAEIVAGTPTTLNFRDPTVSKILSPPEEEEEVSILR